nr:tRNA (adenosine(37)-N6)-dimethylallyltransferase MiaA [Actinomycetota bacterium]
VLIGLDRSAEDLDARVDLRVERMFAEGLVDEVRMLSARGLREGRTASRALGYQQVLAALDEDRDPDVAAAATETARATRRFVRRQRSWFRRDKRITWLDAARPDLVDAALAVARP